MARIDPYLRAVILALCSRIGGKSADEVVTALGISRRTVEHILQRVKKQGFDPIATAFTIQPEYVEDAPRSGRPKKAIEAVANTVYCKVC
ncbi:hypothetical protein CSHISOI_07058 [Colletotrichum shisoi]|uniref:Uncharacterized protein n=1 Tax=Colletotrichum shisoi TaxID=2078593 RepID=A0A5Q4BN41_9PEZI|nr:hypothetical protein CSHISOI_07058 [Colletotrichum shisoi]